MRRAGHPSSLPLAGILLLIQACGGEPEQAPPAAVEAPPFELRPAVEQALSGVPDEAIPAPLSGDAAEEVLGLCQLAAGNPKLVEVAREDAARLGPGGAKK